MHQKLRTMKHTVACLTSPVAVWPAQKTRPGTLTAGPRQIANVISKWFACLALYHYPGNYLQLCGLGGNFSLEISSRDIFFFFQVKDF